MKKDIISGVYTITNIINNKLYIGCSSNIYKRFNDHKAFLRNNSHPNRYLQSVYNKHGKECLKFEILVESDEEFMYSEENYWVNMLSSFDRTFGYNLRLTTPYKNKVRHSEETKFKISQGCKGRRSPQKGKKSSEETKLRLSNSLKGRTINKNSIDKRVKTRKEKAIINGYYMKESTKRKIGDANKKPKTQPHIDALIKSSPNKRKIVMYNFNWEFIKNFDSLSDARRELNCAVNLICMALKDPKRSAKGFKFKYLE